MKENYCGICLHNKYGGWFALRCVYIFKNLEVTDLQKTECPDPLKGNSDRIFQMIKRFNENWEDSTYRDAFPVLEKYSIIEQEYFRTDPGLIKALIRKWLAFKSVGELLNYYRVKDIYETYRNKYLLENFYLI